MLDVLVDPSFLAVHRGEASYMSAGSQTLDAAYLEKLSNSLATHAAHIQTLHELYAESVLIREDLLFAFETLLNWSRGLVSTVLSGVPS